MSNPLLNMISQNVMQRMGMPVNGMQNQQGNNGLNNAISILQNMRASGMTPNQAYQEIMKNPRIAQSIRFAQQKYPNQSFTQIAQNNGFDVKKIWND